MKNLVLVVLLCAASGVVGGGINQATQPTPKVPPACPAQIQPRVSTGEVTDLLERLRPLVKEAYGFYSSTHITFRLSGVELKVESKDGRGTHEVRAATLDAAVKQLIAPDSGISEALREWERAR